MFTGHPETQDIDIQIHRRRKESLKDVMVRTILWLAVTWLAHILLSAWGDSVGVRHLSIVVALTAALCLYIPCWRAHARVMKHLKETKRRLGMSINVPPPR